MKRKKYESADGRAADRTREAAGLGAPDRRAAASLVFEGRDAAGKGGTIKRLHREPQPARRPRRGAVHADRGRGRAVVLPALRRASADAAARSCSSTAPGTTAAWSRRSSASAPTEQRERCFEQVEPFERLLVDDGIRLLKFWLNVGRATQLDRFLDREHDPLKQWKLSRIDVEGLAKWDDYSDAIRETLTRTHTAHAPWTVVRADDKRRARLAAIRPRAGADRLRRQGRGRRRRARCPDRSAAPTSGPDA